MKPVLVASGLKKSWGSTRALDGVDLEVSRGELVVLLGPNGAGKTTLFRLMNGLDVADAGDVLIEGLDIRRQRTRALERLGIVFQEPTIDLEMSVFRNLRYHALLHGIVAKERGKRIGEALREVRLEDVVHAKVRTLSGGNRRRVELARAMLHRPRLLLMDEPSSGLDPASRRDLAMRVDRIRCREGMAVLWATHLVDEASRADRVVILHHGKVLASQPPAHLLARTGARDMGDAFLALTGDVDETAAMEASG